MKDEEVKALLKKVVKELDTIRVLLRIEETSEALERTDKLLMEVVKSMEKLGIA